MQTTEVLLNSIFHALIKWHDPAGIKPALLTGSLIILTILNAPCQSSGGKPLFSQQNLSQLKQKTPASQQKDPASQGQTLPAPTYNVNPTITTKSPQKEYDAVKREIKEDEVRRGLAKRHQLIQVFQNKLKEFDMLNPDSFSVAKAIYLSESAWYDNPPSYEQFTKAIKARSDLAKTIMAREKLDPQNNIAIQYAIQKLYAQDNTFLNPKTRQSVTLPKLGYDFNDPMGDEDYTQLFVTKLLSTGKGQCHSLPLLYLCLAEELGGKAYLSLSPSHSFIQYFDNHNNRYNFETTNGHLVTQVWLMQSNFVNATALKNKTYLDTLSSRQLYAQMLGDLLNAYIFKIGYDAFSSDLINQILKIDSNNMTALLSASNLNTYIATDELKKAGNPPIAQIADFPAANTAYQKMLQGYEQIDQTGFQAMPAHEYQRWLKSVEEEKKKEENKQIQLRMKAEVEALKKVKVKITTKPKG